MTITLLETREYISQQVEAADIADIDLVFDSAAVPLIYVLCSGEPDSIDALCCKCIRMADEDDARPISTDLVKKADKLLRQKCTTSQSSAAAGSLRVNGTRSAGGRLITRMNGIVIHEQDLGQGQTLIGRDNLCDIPVNSPAVSRRHAVVVSSLAGVGLVDLGSKNGTFVDGRRVEKRVLQNGDMIAVGDCTITYFAGDDLQA